MYISNNSILTYILIACAILIAWTAGYKQLIYKAHFSLKTTNVFQYVLLLFSGIILGSIITGVAIDIEALVKTEKPIETLEIIYYLSGPLGVFVTFLVSVIAIFGDNVKGFFLRERCHASIEKGRFLEILPLDTEDENIKARKHRCSLTLTNTGSCTIHDLQLYLIGVKYRKTDKSQWQQLFDGAHVIYARDINDSLHLTIGEKITYPIAEIHPESAFRTPDDIRSSHTHMSIIAFPLKDRHNHKGEWQLSYRIKTPERTLKEFEVLLTWEGEWKNRDSEFKYVSTANIV